MKRQEVTFVYPGDLDTRTGGYRYDKRIIHELQSNVIPEHRWNVTLMSLHGDYPFPSTTQLTDALRQIADIPDGTLTVIDGLAYGVMPEVIKLHAERLLIVALVHHPLALETGLSDSQSAQLRELETQALRYAHRVITTSHLTALSLADYHVATEMIQAILPGTDSANISAGSRGDCAELLCVATLTPRKGHSVLLDALKQITDIPWHLNCAGSLDRDSATYQTLVHKCHQNGISSNVSFVGELSDSQLDQYYDKADLFVLASYHEGYGMVLTEAIARGLPIVCSDAGAMPHTVPDGAGILVPAGDDRAFANAIRNYFTNEMLRTRLRQAALDAREQLRNWHQASVEFSCILQQVSDTQLN